MAALSNISESLSQKGQLAEAAEPIEKAVEIARERARELPEDSEHEAELADMLSRLAGVCRDLGRSTDAEGHEREAAALRPKTRANHADAAGASGRLASEWPLISPAVPARRIFRRGCSISHSNLPG